MRPLPARPQVPSGEYPMEVRNGKVVGAWQQRVFEQRAPFVKDYDFTQRPFRRYVNAGGYLNVQFPSGLERRQWLGIRYPYRGAGWLWGFATPRIPAQTRSMSGAYGGGITPKPASMSQLQSIIAATIGGLPVNPAGTGPPGQFYGDYYDLPGTG